MTRPWTQTCVAALYMMQQAHADLAQMAFTLGRPRGEVDVALNALLGRSIPAAVAALNTPKLAARREDAHARAMVGLA